MDERAFLFLFGFLVLAGLLSAINQTASLNPAGAPDEIPLSDFPCDTEPCTEAHTTQSPTSISQGSTNTNTAATTNNTTPSENLTEEELRQKIEDLSDEAWELEKELHAYQRTQPESRYAQWVTLRANSTKTSDPDREYFTITLDKKAPNIDISDWYMESYVSENRANIPDGVYVYKAGGSINRTAPIILEPNQRAYVYTGESPLGFSYQENSCFGYLRNENLQSGYPSCPRPINLMERYADIALDDDSCYDYVESLRSCEVVDYDDEELNHLSGSCRSFVRNYLNYNSCVEQFSWQASFDDDNDWYIYFNRDEALWRPEREILRLRDEYDDIVAVIEY